METRRRQVGRGAVAAAVLVLGVGAVTVIQGNGPPEYSSSVTFFLKRPGKPDSASVVARSVDLSAALLDADGLATRVIGDLDLDLTVDVLRDEIEVTTEPDSVILTATVTDPSAERALAIARAIAAQPIAVDPAGTELVVIEAPELDPNPR